MRKINGTGFALVELLTALFIVCILVIALTTIYDSSTKAISAINQRIEKGGATSEIMWLIVDDITKASSADTDTTFLLKTKIFDGAALYRLEIASKVFDNTGKELIYQKVIWQSDYDIYTRTISLYRSKGGMMPLDPVLGAEQAGQSQSDIFVPVCHGLTYFTIQIPQVQDTPQGQIVNYLDQWGNDEMPGGVIVDLSFEQPVEYVTGEVEVLPEDRLIESISLNRSKEYKFQFIAKDLDAAYAQEEEPVEDETMEEDTTGEEPPADTEQTKQESKE